MNKIVIKLLKTQWLLSNQIKWMEVEMKCVEAVYHQLFSYVVNMLVFFNFFFFREKYASIFFEAAEGQKK